MSKVLFFLFIIYTCCISLSKPKFGIALYYLISILGPQYIWWWLFQGLRVSFIIALFTITGVCLNFINKNYDLRFLFNKQNLWLLILWFFIAISYFFGPYVSEFRFSGIGPAKVFAITNSIFIFYFISTLEINETSKLRNLVIIFVISTVFLIYWANAQYFNQNWLQFAMGRLMGPISASGDSLYADSNSFAMLFVCGLPFLYYFGWELKKSWLRWALWATIPLGWHAIFLTGSRGGLVGIAVIMVFIILMSQRKFFVLPLMMFFLVFYQWQAGDVMKERSDKIVNIQGEQSASDRVNAWKGGLRMVLSNPITGVGIGSFITAVPDYIKSRHMVAHNTFIQFTAESGVVAGMAYLTIVFLFFRHSNCIRRWCRTDVSKEENKQIDMYNKASTASFAGLLVCGLFLSLNIYEPFFLLLLFNNTLYQIYLKKSSQGQVA